MLRLPVIGVAVLQVNLNQHQINNYEKTDTRHTGASGVMFLSVARDQTVFQ
jgi:hypothetical protein